MLDEFQEADFAPRLGQLFEVRLAEDLVVPLHLASVAGLDSSRGPGRRHPFSLLFLGPQAAQYLRQGAYRLHNEGLGTFDLFIVPLGPQGGRMQYEAIFN